MSSDSESLSSASERNNASSQDPSSSTEDLSSSHASCKSPNFQEKLGARETKHVLLFRTLFVSVLLIAAVVASVLTYIYSSRSEEMKFENEFADFASEIKDVSQHNAVTIHGVFAGLSVSLTSLTVYANVSWPNFTAPDFDQHAERAFKTSGTDFLAFSPVVHEEERTKWEAYAQENQGWIYESRIHEGSLRNGSEIQNIPAQIYPNSSKADHEDGVTHFLPVWQTAPAPNPATVNFNILSIPRMHDLLDFVFDKKEPLLAEIIVLESIFGDEANNEKGHPHSLLMQPVLDNFHAESSVVALLVTAVPWDNIFTNLLHHGARGIIAVVTNTCGDIFTYEINGPEARFLGNGDHHDSTYDDFLFTSDFEPFDWHTDKDNSSTVNCHYTMNLYPSDAIYSQYHTKKPALLTSAVVIVFAFTSMVFMIYDCLVQRRQVTVMDSAVRSNAIVSSLFPADVRDRLFRNSLKKKRKQDPKGQKSKGSFLPTLSDGTKFRMKNFMHDENASQVSSEHRDLDESKPIADLFPNATVMFADIAGFTAWSSVRDPAQVFTLLETVYRAFDHIAKRRRVFKVETIGDCYVAVVGLPEPRKDHAIVMCRFARDCLEKINELTKQLEVTLGPDTGDLAMRFGLHSGPVTAGVLRGERSRFQLFGDTVNTCARMESTGEKNKIQISVETAELLKEAEKGHWITPREECVVAKGKGELQTFWLRVKGQSSARHSVSQDETNLDDSDHEIPTKSPHADSDKLLDIERSAKTQRLIGWNVDVLLRLLKQIVSARNQSARSFRMDEKIQQLELEIGEGTIVAEEVKEFIELPEADTNHTALDIDSVELGPVVLSQLREYVTAIASMYHKNSFHNFEHASHVTMSVTKLLSRIVALNTDLKGADETSTKSLHELTYGIASDPLTQFAMVFSALVHDVDHKGVPNFVLIQEDERLASIYKGKSIAEQNSVDVAWEVLMGPEFNQLRACIYSSESELQRFRELLVTTVMATDIFDKELGALRRSCWEKAFSLRASCSESEHMNRMATIVIELLIQASDIAHTMQHWQIFEKWNERLFNEMHTAYKEGRLSKDPSEGWYFAELAFFDNYVIPLAKKLEDCGVFGAASDEYLNYAVENRKEWAAKGESVVEKLKKNVARKEFETSRFESV